MKVIISNSERSGKIVLSFCMLYRKRCSGCYFALGTSDWAHKIRADEGGISTAAGLGFSE
jgi:hypothetical protein